MLVDLRHRFGRGGRWFAAIGLTLLSCFGSLCSALYQRWPMWMIGLATLIPWLPAFSFDVARRHQRYAWLALFYVLVVTQTGHLLEHAIQMIQLHVLGLGGANARGVFGSLDLESVHFVWNAWVLVAVLVLVSRFRTNLWLWLTLLLGVWHGLEHAYIFSVYLSTGVVGTPGLLSQGGFLAGGLPINRPDLHFVYNLVETVPLLVAFIVQEQTASTSACEQVARGKVRRLAFHKVQ